MWSRACRSGRRSNNKPVKDLADAPLPVGGEGLLPFYLSSDWPMPLPAISRAVIVLHGHLRNVDRLRCRALMPAPCRLAP
ncbi:hypothetical protein [Bradyrhizobium sp. CCBAU 51627]|uniref:hypothetical protein n=1 Tax=Bradyrhizobium sp. CCBAU 51627 TaxID=1325088 RepID=UPI002305D6DF|nr:hypothetical protein [Bradyrhizobium sp. CCBAU 51627]